MSMRVGTYKWLYLAWWGALAADRQQRLCAQMNHLWDLMTAEERHEVLLWEPR